MSAISIVFLVLFKHVMGNIAQNYQGLSIQVPEIIKGNVG